jgi:small subunit ribosomal protein S12
MIVEFLIQWICVINYKKIIKKNFFYMSSLLYLAKYGRILKRRRPTAAALGGAPNCKGLIVKMATTTPRKPNSAKRKYAKVRVIKTKKVVHAHIPGDGDPKIREYSVVFIEGGSPPDVPGVNYSLVRGVYDFDAAEAYGRRKRRSKFGLKTPIDIKQQRLSLKKELKNE